MSGLAGALPDYQSKHPRAPPQNLQRLPSGPPAFSLGYAAPQVSPFAGQTTANNPGYNSYSPQYASPYQQADPTAQAFTQAQTGHSPHSGGVNSSQTSYIGQHYFPNQGLPYVYYPGQYGSMAGQQQGGQGHPGSYPSTYNRNPGLQYAPGYFTQQDGEANAMVGKVPPYGSYGPGPWSSMNYGSNQAVAYLRPGSMPGKRISHLRPSTC